MAENKRPIPVPDPASQPFFDGTKRRELMLQRCSSCGTVMFPVKVRCDVCFGGDLVWQRVSGRGKLYSYAVVHQVDHPGFADQIPYNIALVELEEGIRITSSVVGCPNSELRVDMPLEVTFEALSEEVSIPRFRRAG